MPSTSSLCLWHFCDGLYFGRIRLQALVRQKMSHKIYFTHPQFHLVWIKDNAVMVCSGFFVGLSGAINEDIVRDA